MYVEFQNPKVTKLKEIHHKKRSATSLKIVPDAIRRALILSPHSLME